MQRATGFMLTSAGLLLASQVIFMNMEESLHMADGVVLAEVTAKVTFPMSYCDRTEYFFGVIEVVSGDESLKDEFFGDYLMEFPTSWVDEQGNEVWESPILTRSGHEMLVEKGDTVLVFLGCTPTETEQHIEVLRIEPPDSLGSILLLLSDSQPFPDTL